MKNMIMILALTMSVSGHSQTEKHFSELDYFKYFMHVSDVENSYDLRDAIDDTLFFYLEETADLPLNENNAVVIVDENSFTCKKNICSFRADQGVEKIDKFGNFYREKYPNAGLTFELTFKKGEEYAGQEMPLIKLTSVE